MNLTTEQQAILSWIDLNKTAATTPCAIIRARAGSGKTFILTEICKRLPPPPTFYDQPIFLAFNKAIADELAKKLPPSTKSSTFHSLGYQRLKERYGTKTNTRKYSDLIQATLPGLTYEERTIVLKILEHVRNAGLTPTELNHTSLDILDLLPTDVDPEDLPANFTVRELTDILVAGVLNTSECDFTDMLYLPVCHSMRFKPPRFVLVDEAQDTNPLQLKLLSLLRDERTTFIFVGDDRQAIYGFRGAHANALDVISHQFAITTVFPLTVTFRCPTSVVEVARQEVPDFTARHDAPAGRVHRLVGNYYDFPTGTLVVCRNNKPLARLAMTLLSAREPFEVTSPFFKTLSRWVTSLAKPHESLAILRTRVLVWEEEQMATRPEQYHEYISERASTLCALIAEMPEGQDTSALLTKLAAICDAKGGTKLSTIHRAKGTEAPIVVFLAPELIPSRFATTEEQSLQERNLWYVAVTRALETLVFLTPTKDPLTSLTDALKPQHLGLTLV